MLTPSVRLVVFFSLALLFQSGTSFAAHTWHVAGTGDDSHDGTTAETAFRTLEKATDSVHPGDTVLIGDGTYTDEDTSSSEAIATLDEYGSPDAWTTWKAADGAHPELRPTKVWNALRITGAYIIIDGLRITGANDSIAFIDALADGAIREKNDKPYTGSPHFNTNGISVEGRHNAPDRKPHHIVIRNCTVSECPGGGIVMLESDYFTIEDCLVFDNAWYMRYAGSGITALDDWAFDEEPGYHVVIQRNRVWNNKTLVPWSKIGKLSDGNGILLDVTDLQTSGGATNPNADAALPSGKPPAAETPAPAVVKPPRPEWKARALIANNLSAYNGGSGIHTFRTRHVDIINNTTYWNGSSVNYQELFPNRSDDIVILNNIIVPRPSGKVTSNNHNTNVRWDYNLYSTDQNIFKGPHDVVADPRFLNVRRDLREADFHLAAGSPGRDSGTDDTAQATDLEKTPRPAGAARDRGAFEQ